MLDALPKQGHFKHGDKVDKVISSRIVNKCIHLWIEWQTRKNGILPLLSVISTEEIKIYDKDFLLEFYENKILKVNV